jgi:DICT domain-containing protein/nitrogen-specific signal transduction histidine kinase
MGLENSLLQELLQTIPSVNLQIYFKASLTALSHAMEDLVLAGDDQPLVIANFQQERFYRQETQRYHRIAQRTDQVYVLAAPETDFATAPTPYATIALNAEDDLAQEWHLVIVGRRYSACLVCREYAAPVDAIALDTARQFRGFWSFDPELTRQAAIALLRQIGYYRPDLATAIAQTQTQYQLNQPRPASPGLPFELDVQLFSDRLVTYLQANQYKQVKAYRRVVEQERQERFVNQTTAAIRRSLQPADVLAETVRQVAQLFDPCRCFVYRLPKELSPLLQNLVLNEYEAGTDLPSLIGCNWRLGQHPHFRSNLHQGKLVAIADTQQDSGLQNQADLQPQLEQMTIRALLLVPICYQSHCIAVLELHRMQPQLWSEEDRALLLAIAQQVGLVLAQAEAYVSLQQLNQQLTAIKQTQNNLVAIVGHELRTPLSTIQVCLESLELEPDMPWEMRQSMVEIALADAARLRRLIQDFLLLSRLENELSTWQVEAVNLVDAIDLAISQVQGNLPASDRPTIKVTRPDDLPFAIADSDALAQLLNRLLDNACKFTPAAGLIKVSLTVNSPKNKPSILVQITDTGRGIAAAQLETIFEQFHQEEGFLRRSVGGTGLGLAICRQLVRQMGGRIWATSAGKDQGSQFYFTVPAAID